MTKLEQVEKVLGVTLEDLKARKSKIEFELRMSKGSLVSHNIIVVVGAYTVGTKHGTKEMELQNKDTPSRWTEAGYEEIKSLKAFKNIYGEVIEPESVFYKDWYKRQLESINMTIEALEKVS